MMVLILIQNQKKIKISYDGTLTSSGPITSNGTLTATGLTSLQATTINGTLTANGLLNTNAITSGGLITATAGLTVSNAPLNVYNDLSVAGATNLQQPITMTYPTTTTPNWSYPSMIGSQSSVALSSPPSSATPGYIALTQYNLEEERH
jgi:hypothetical protein